jgi:hypothetical protein
MADFRDRIKRRHLVAALLIILVGLIALYYFEHQGAAVEEASKCSAKGLAIFQVGNVEICRDRDTGLLYAP